MVRGVAHVGGVSEGGVRLCGVQAHAGVADAELIGGYLCDGDSVAEHQFWEASRRVRRLPCSSRRP